MNKIKCIDILSPVIWFLILGGLFPAKKYRHFQLTKLFLHFLFYSLIVNILVLDIIKAINTKNLVMFNKVTSITLPILNAGAKALAILCNHQPFLSLLEDLKSATFNEHSKSQNSYIRLVDRLSKILLKVFIAVSIIYVFIVSILPVVTNVTILIPAPIEMGRYSLFYKFLHLLMTCYLAYNSISFDVLFVTLISLGIAQLNILEQKLINIYEAVNDTLPTSKHPRQFLENYVLRECAILHELISRFIKKLNIVLSLPLFVQYICGCFIICSTILQITILGQMDTVVLLTIASFIIVVFGQLALYHWLGNEIMLKAQETEVIVVTDSICGHAFQSSSIAKACYLSKWYKLCHPSQKTLQLIMERSKYPIQVELYKYICISLESLAVIVRWSYSLFALIKARYK